MPKKLTDNMEDFMKPVDESSISKSQWFGQNCQYQNRQFEDDNDKSIPVLVFCNHTQNPEDCEGNCRADICPLIKEMAGVGNA